MNRLTLILLTLAGTVAGHAQIVSSTNVVFVPGGATDFTEGSLEDDQNMFLRYEGRVTLGASIDVGLTMPGSYTPIDDAAASIAAGTVLDSYYLHFDPVGASPTITELSSSVTFAGKIVGVIFTTPELLATNALFAPGYTFSTMPGLEGRDTFAFDENTFWATFRANTIVDDVRIFVEPPPVPEPSTLGFAGAGLLAALVAWRRRRPPSA